MHTQSKFYDENSTARVPGPSSAAAALRDSTNLVPRLTEKNAFLLDSPESPKETAIAPPVIYTNAGPAKFTTPSKLAAGPNATQGEDLVNMDTPEGRSSKGTSGGKSVAGSEVPSITPRTRINQLRFERRDSHAPDFEVTDRKVTEMQEELRNLPGPKNATAARMQRTGEQMKESLLKLRSIGVKPPKTQEGSQFQIVAHAPLPEVTSTKAKIDTMEEQLEKESEEVRARISGIEARLGLEERLVEQTWQVRRNAYAEIGRIFAGKSGDGPEARPDRYASWLGYMLKDSNLIALQEGLNTVLAYTQFQAETSLGPTAGLVPDLLDRVPVHRPQFQDTVTKILGELIRRGQARYVVSELVARFSGTKKIGKGSQFPVSCLTALMRTELCEKVELRTVYKAAAKALNGSQREAKIALMKLMQVVFELAEDSVEVFVGHMPGGTKPLLIKELAETLRATSKRSVRTGARLFPEVSAPTIPTANAPQSQLQPETKKPEIRRVSPKRNNETQSAETVVLYDFVNEEIFKLVYLTKAEEKKTKIEELNASLDSLVKRGCKVERKDYSALANVLGTLLEDTNVFLQLEVLRAFQLLAVLLGRDMVSLKPKGILGKLLDRLRENKTAVIVQIEATVAEMLARDCIPAEAVVDAVMQRLASSKNPRVRQFSLQLLLNRISSEEENARIPVKVLEQTFTGIIGPKLLSAIQRDPAGSVRDIAVKLIAKIKQTCPDFADIDATIAKLPKPRIQEIQEISRGSSNREKLVRAPIATRPKKSVKDALRDLRRSKSEMQLPTISPDQGSSGHTSCDKLLAEVRAGLGPRVQILRDVSSHLEHNAVPTHAAALAEGLSRVLDAGGKIEREEIDCAVACGIALPEGDSSKFAVLRAAYRAAAGDIDRFVLAVQKTLYQLKYSDKEDPDMAAGVKAYQTVAGWLTEDCGVITQQDMEKLLPVLSVTSSMGFKEEFVAAMDGVRTKIKRGMQKSTEVAESKTQLEAVRNSEANGNKKAVEDLDAFLGEVCAQDFVEQLCKQLGKAQWLEDDVLRVLFTLRSTVPVSEARKLVKQIMCLFAEVMRPDAPAEKLLGYYRILNEWTKEMPKREICELITQIFSDQTSTAASQNSLAATIHWLRTQILGELFAENDMEPILGRLIGGLRGPTAELRRECEYLVTLAYKVFGPRHAQTWIEGALAGDAELAEVYADWRCSIGNKDRPATAPKVEDAESKSKTTLPQMIANQTAMSSQNTQRISFDSSSSGNHATKVPNKEEEGNENEHLKETVTKEVATHETKEEGKEEKKEITLLEQSAEEEVHPASPHFGSELGKQQLDKGDSPLSIQELDNGNSESKPNAVPLPKSPREFQRLMLYSTISSTSLSDQFAKLSDSEERLALAKAMNSALANEDVAECISAANLQSLADACLIMCTDEKIRIAAGGAQEIICACNTTISELQECLTRIVNSHSATVVLTILVSIMREYLPADFTLELTKQQAIRLRLLTVCLHKTFVSACSGGPMQVRAFPLLLELFKLFQMHPPEKLKQTLPSLPVFDGVYRVLRGLTDGLVECDVEKGVAFVAWAERELEAEGAVSPSFLSYVKSAIVRVANKAKPNSICVNHAL